MPFFSIHSHQAIPAHSAMFIELGKQQLESIISNSNKLVDLFVPKNIADDYSLLQDILESSTDEDPNRKITITINPSQKEGLDLLFITNGKPDLKYDSSGWESKKYHFKNRELTTLKKGDKVCSFTQFQNLFIFAEHAYLVENAISQLRSPAGSVCNNKRFRSFYKNSTSDNLDIYFNLENLSAQFSPLINAAKIHDLKSIGTLGQWMHFSIPISNNESFNGNLLPQAANALLTVNQGNLNNIGENIWNTIPNNLSGVIALKLNGAQNLFTSKYLNGQIGDNVALAFGESLDGAEMEQFLMLSLKDGEELEKLISKEITLENTSRYQMFDIWQIEDDFFPAFIIEKLPYATIIENYILLGKSNSSLERWLGKYIAGQSLSKEITFLELKSTLPPESNALLYLNGTKSWQQVSTYLNNAVLNSLNGNPIPFETLAGSLIWEKGMGKFNFKTVQNITEQKQSANIFWNAPLRNFAAGKPLVTINPQSEENEIFISDINNRIYLISRSGRILWQRQIDEPILSEVTPIDFNNNRHRQFVFSTRSAIYMVDENGNDVDGFPLKLQVPASNGLTVIDFYQSNDYSFFVACENGKAYGFDEKGSPIEGWRPNENVGIVEHPLLHFQAGGKDFLALLDVYGTLRVFKKNGSYRFKNIPFERTDLRPLGFQVTTKGSRMVTADSTGRVYVINLSGDHFGLQLSNNNLSNKFLFSDVISDERKDYISLAENKISINFYDKNKFIKGDLIKYPWPQDEVFNVSWGRSRKSFIGSLNKEKNLIFLMDGNGRIPDQFPLAGSTPFVIEDLAGDGKPIVITGNKNAVTTYILD